MAAGGTAIGCLYRLAAAADVVEECSICACSSRKAVRGWFRQPKSYCDMLHDNRPPLACNGQSTRAAQSADHRRSRHGRLQQAKPPLFSHSSSRLPPASLQLQQHPEVPADRRHDQPLPHLRRRAVAAVLLSCPSQLHSRFQFGACRYRALVDEAIAYGKAKGGADVMQVLATAAEYICPNTLRYFRGN